MSINTSMNKTITNDTEANSPYLLRLAANEDLDTDSPQLSPLYSDVDPVLTFGRTLSKFMNTQAS